MTPPHTAAAQAGLLLSKPRLLDLFCKAGGATKGYQRAGFHVTGVDIEPQKHYCGDEFVQADALEYVAQHGWKFDAIHASPPCQKFSRLTPVEYRDNHPAYTEWLGKQIVRYVISAPVAEQSFSLVALAA